MKYMKQIELDPYAATITVTVKNSNVWVRADIDADESVNRFATPTMPIKTLISKITDKVRDMDTKEIGNKLKKIGFAVVAE